MFDIQEKHYFDAGIMPYTFHQTESEETETFEIWEKGEKRPTKKETVTQNIKRCKYYAPGIIITINEIMNYPNGSGINPLRSGKIEVEINTDIAYEKATGMSGGWFGYYKLFDTFEEAMTGAREFVKEWGKMAEEGFIENMTFGSKVREAYNPQSIADVFGEEFGKKCEDAYTREANKRQSEDKYLEKLRKVFHTHFGIKEAKYFQHYMFNAYAFVKFELEKNKEDLTAFELKLIRKLSKVTWSH